MTITRENIATAIRGLGVRPGDLMIVHSSFRSFGPRGTVEGGPIAVAQALVDAVSPAGSVFVPTFTYGIEPYDPNVTRSHDGAISEFVRKLPGAIRSLHPTHSMAGVGPDAESIVKDHDAVQPFGRNSPCWRLWERDAWVLLIGANHNANSVAHVAEELLEMPYLDRRRSAKVARGGDISEVVIRRPGCSDAWDPVLDPPLRAMGTITETRVGESRLMLMRARDVVQTTKRLLESNRQSLLCDASSCEACQQAREMIARAS